MKPAAVIVGLGNPGAAYADTRHNAGYMAVDRLAEAFGESPWKESQKFHADICEARIVTVPLILAKPRTYMNRSGESIRALLSWYKLDPATAVLVCCDDIDLPLGAKRLRMRGGPGTHNGLKSVQQQYGEEYPRLRIGIGTPPSGTDLAPWVLSAFSEQERVQLEQSLAEIPEMVRTFVLGE